MRLALAACAVLALAVLLAARRRPAWSGAYPLGDAEGDDGVPPLWIGS